MDTTQLMTPELVAKKLGISVQTLAVWRCEKRYLLPYIKVGSRVRYRPSEVESFYERQTRGTARRR